jgi:hypothetical protein
MKSNDPFDGFELTKALHGMKACFHYEKQEGRKDGGGVERDDGPCSDLAYEDACSAACGLDGEDSNH